MIVLPALSGGGAERVALYLAEGLRDHGHEVILVAFDAQGPYRDDVPTGVELVDFATKDLKVGTKALRKLVEERRPDVINSHLDAVNLASIFVRLLVRPRPRVAITLHNGLERQYMGDVPDWKKKRFKMMRVFFRFADAAIGVGPGVHADMVRLLGIRKDRAFAIENPVVTPGLAARAAQPIEDPWFGPDQPPVIVAMGRLSPEKGFPMLLKAWSILEKRTDARLLILGEGSQRAELEALVDELRLDRDRVRLPGFVANPYAYLAKARLFAFSSVFEGTPLALIEALACGLPVVSTDCTYGPRTILKDGEYGRLVPVGDHDAFAAAILEALNETPKPAPPDALAPYLLETAVLRYEQVLFPQRRES
ncbi:glycosyltransferase [bacterium]|nr:MAG: glycosyltransferase [bacterium]